MNNWKETTLGEVAELQRGFDLPTQNRKKGRYPLMVSNGQDGAVQHFKVEAPGIVTGRSGTIGKVFLVQENFWPLNTTLWVKDFHGNDVRYVYYLLKTIPLEKFNTGTGVPTLNRNYIHSYPVLLPSLPEQKEIAAVLSSLDDKIELLREQNKSLEAMAQTIFKEWFVNFNFPDENGKPYKNAGGKMIDSELGEIPEGWKVGKLGDEFEIIMGQSPSGESYNEKGNGMIFFQGRAEFQERFPKIRLYTTEPKRFAEKFDVLVSVRAPVGDINVAFDKCCIGRGVGAVRSGQKSYSLYKIMSLKEDFDKFEAEGTVFGSINKDGFLNIKVVISPREIVKNFEEVASSIDQKIFNNYSQIKTLSHLRDTLMPKLMSGNVMINN